MNESEKNIETCLPESILAEVASVPTDPQFVSLVNESLDPLKQQAVQQAGSDAYNEVVASHQPYTFTSSVRQMKSNLIMLLRRFWRFPFGTGTLRSLSDMWAHYISRLSGNETYGIPSRLSQLTDLPSAPLLVADRKISGVPEAEDGMSLVHQLGNSAAANAITEIDDDNHGWVLDKAIGNIAPNCEKATIRCKEISAVNGLRSFKSKELYLPETETITSGASQYNDIFPTTPWLIDCPVLTYAESIIYDNTNAEIISMPELVTTSGRSFYNVSNLSTKRLEMRVPKLKTFDTWSFLMNAGGGSAALNGYPDLILLEIGSDVSCDIHNWCPTNALSMESNDLVTNERTTKPEGVDVSNWKNLDLFLSNFRDYIALRLTDNGSGKTLTLSQAVFSAVIEGASPICNEIKGIIEDKGWKVQDTNNNIFPTT